MPNCKIYDVYDNFAWFYDKYWRSWPKTLLPILEKVFFFRLPENGLVLDLCCGQGQITALFLERGYRAVGVDGSEEMLRYARRNAPGVEFIHADARDFTVPEVCDAALCAYDSLNHIMTIEELGSAFGCIRRALKPGAPFIFDLNVDEGFRTNWIGSYGKVGEDNAIIHAGSYDPEARRAELAITMFRLRDGSWHRSDLTISEKCYSEAEVLDALDENGFEKTELFYPVREFGWKVPGRLFYVTTARG